MFAPKTSKSVRVAAAVLALLLLAAVLFSAFFIALEADHDCCGEDCAVCVCIRLCENTLRQLSGGILLMVFAVLPALFVLFAVSAAQSLFAVQTPVAEKVRLNN